MTIKRLGIGLAKHVFQVHGVDCRGKAVNIRWGNYRACKATALMAKGVEPAFQTV